MIEVHGADQLARLAKQLREAGAKDLQKELGQAINRALRPVKADVRKSARATLPSRGGFAAKVGKSTLSTRRRTSQKTAGIRLVARNTISLYHPDQGQIRHRKGGKIDAGKVQPIQSGWWTRPTEAAAPEVRRQLVQAMDAVGRKIGRGV